MNKSDYLHLASEISFLGGMLKKTGMSKFSAKSIESRLGRAKTLASQYEDTGRAPAKAVITFRGSPVRGTHGIAADFGANATRAFNDAVAAVAASLTGALADKGPIPNRPQNQLLITGTALGSFGFVLEEAPENSQLMLEGTTAVSQALDIIVDLLEASTKSDEELSESVSKVANRAISTVSEFLSQLSDNGASCTLVASGKQFRFSNVEQVILSKARLSLDNIKEHDDVFEGVFLGALPERRTFEFRAADGSVMHGTIAKDVENPGSINDHLRERVRITTHTRIVGSSKPRYSISELPW